MSAPRAAGRTRTRERRYTASQVRETSTTAQEEDGMKNAYGVRPPLTLRIPRMDIQRPYPRRFWVLPGNVAGRSSGDSEAANN